MAIRYGIMGLGCHEAGWFYVPAPDTGAVEVRHWKFGGHLLDFHISGTGAYAEVRLNGHPVKGTLQISPEMMDGMPAEVDVRIRRHSRKSPFPVLLNSYGGRIRIVKAVSGSLTLEICQDGCFPLSIWSPGFPTVMVNEGEVHGQWNERHQTVHVDRRWHRGDRLECSC